MPKLSDVEMARRRNRIVKAARACFGRNGFDASIDDVCAEAGLSKGAVYGHFKSKEHLIYAIAEDQAVALAALAEGRSYAQMREAFLELFVRPAGNEPEAQLEVHALSMAFSDPRLKLRLQANWDLIGAALRNPIEASADAGEIRLRLGLEETVQILHIFVLGLFSKRVVGRGDLRPGMEAAFLNLLDGLIEVRA